MRQGVFHVFHRVFHNRYVNFPKPVQPGLLPIHYDLYNTLNRARRIKRVRSAHNKGNGHFFSALPAVPAE